MCVCGTATVLAVLVAVWLVADTVVDVARPYTLSALSVDTRPIAQQHHIGIYIDMELPGMECQRLPSTLTLFLLSFLPAAAERPARCFLCCVVCAVCHRVWL